MRSLIVLAVLSLVMCGGKSDNSSNPQTPDSSNPQAPVSNLSVEQQKAFCDYEASLVGGYGGSLPCGSDPSFHSYDGPMDQASCVTGLSSQFRMCPVSTEQAESCLQWSVQNFCTVMTPMPAACATFLSQQCGN
jgi:hypothetical protein